MGADLRKQARAILQELETRQKEVEEREELLGRQSELIGNKMLLVEEERDKARVQVDAIVAEALE